MGRRYFRREKLESLANTILCRLSDGLPQDQATLDTVCMALGEPDIHAALALLSADPEAAEHAPLAALLLSPGPAVFHRLESELCRAEVDADEVLELAELVVRQFTRFGENNQARALLPDGTRAELPVSTDGLRAFVRSLRAEATPPPELRAVLARRLVWADGLKLELAVLLRHCRLDWTPERVLFISTLLERAEANSDHLPGLLAWATGFLEDLDGEPEHFDLRRWLAARRQALLSQLRQAEFMEEALLRGNYETLLSQGLRFAHVHGPDVRAELGFLERAAWLALGLPGAALDGVNVRDLGQAEDAEQLLGLLPGLEEESQA